MFYDTTSGMKYDWVAIFLTHLIPLSIRSKNKYTCSHWCATVLGLDKPHEYSPQELIARVL